VKKCYNSAGKRVVVRVVVEITMRNALFCHWFGFVVCMRRLCGEAALIAAWLLQVVGLLSDLWPGRVHREMAGDPEVCRMRCKFPAQGDGALGCPNPRAEGGGNLSFSIECPDVSVCLHFLHFCGHEVDVIVATIAFAIVN
jgi:hypothetical protein